MVMRQNATSGTPTSPMREALLILLLCFFFAPCTRAAEQTPQGGNGVAREGKEQAEFVDPNEAPPSKATTGGDAGELAQPVGELAEPAGELAEPARATAAAAAAFADPDAREEPFVSRNSGAPTGGDIRTSEAAEVVSPGILEKLAHDAVISTVEQPVNTSYEAEGEVVNVAEGETKGAGAPAVPPVDEKAANELIKSALAAQGATGALAYFKDKRLTESSFAKAVKEALERNLTIRFSEKNYEKSDAAITQAKAIKDPVFNVSLNGTQKDTYIRREYIVRRRFVQNELQNRIGDVFSQVPDTNQPNPTSSTDTALVSDDVITVVPSVDGFSTRGAFEQASARSKSRSETLTTNYLHQLPWGSAFSWSLSSTHNKILLAENRSEDSFHIDNPDDPSSAIFNSMDAKGNLIPRKNHLVVSPGTPHTVFYEMDARIAGWVQEEWASNFSLQLTVPVPYSKDWGPNGSAEIPTKQAMVAQERAYWQLQSAINSTLLNVNNAYWGVVSAVRRLEVTITNRKSLEQILKQTEDLLKLNRVTDYEISQAKTQVKGAQVAEEGAWQVYVSASNALKHLLNYDKDAVLLPVGYAGDLAGGITFKAGDVLPLALASNPDLRIAKASVDLAAVSLKFAHNQVRPDLKVTSGVNWNQNGAPFGFSHFYNSLDNLFRADTRNGFVTLNYRVPWGNRPAEDALDLAEEQYKQSEKSMAAVAGAVSRQVNDAVAAVLSAREQTAIAFKNTQKAEEVLKLVTDLWAQGRVPDTAAVKNTPTFTLLAKNTELLSARLRYIVAQIGLKQAEGQLLAAQGIIAARYSEDLKISVKPVAEPGKKEDAKPQAEKKDTEKKEEPAK